MIRHALRHSNEHAVSRPRVAPRPAKRAAPQSTEYYNPATGKELGREPNTDLSAMADMMSAARAAQKEWASYSFRQRKSVILAIRDHVIGDADRLARIVSENSGKTRIDALATEGAACSPVRGLVRQKRGQGPGAGKAGPVKHTLYQ